MTVGGDDVSTQARSVEMAREWLTLDNGRPHHPSWCDYTRRSPAVRDDCGCGALTIHEARLMELAFDLAEAVLSEAEATGGPTDAEHAPLGPEGP